MNDLINHIKELAHDISESFLLYNSDVNNSILNKYMSGDISNREILKRVCELVNQNIYLSLFNDPSVDNSNIQFDYADYDKLIQTIKENEGAMSSYSAPPSDFRSSLGDIVEAVNNVNETDNTQSKLASINASLEEADKINNLINTLESIKEDAIKTAEQSYLEMDKQAKIAIAQGDSLADLAKLASVHAKNLGLDFMKVAAAYDTLGKDYHNSGLKFRDDLTKVSSQLPKPDSEIYQPSEKLATSIGVIESVDDMISGLKKIASAFGEELDRMMEDA